MDESCKLSLRDKASGNSYNNSSDFSFSESTNSLEETDDLKLLNIVKVNLIWDEAKLRLKLESGVSNLILILKSLTCLAE